MELRNLKLATKQTIGFGLILVIMAGVNIFSISRMAELKTEIDEVSTNWLPRVIAISEINLNTSDLRSNQLQHAYATDQAIKREQANKMITLIDNINENRDTYEQLRTHSEKRKLYSDEARKLYAEFDRKWEAYQDLSFIFFKLSRDNESQRAVELLNGESREVFNDFSTDLVELVSVDKKDAYNASRRAEITFKATRDVTIILLIVTILLSVLIASVLVRLITVPVQQLERAAKSVTEGDLEVRLDALKKDEIGSLAQSFNQMTIALGDAKERTRREARLRAEAAELKIKTKEAEAKALKMENERKTHELEEARKLQLSMLPKRLPELQDLDIAVYMKTATEVGGDYYDFHLAEDGTLTVAIGDATGHGMQAGTMVASVKSLFRALGGDSDISRFFNKSSSILNQMSMGNLYMSMMMVRINNSKMMVSSAGMPPILIYRNESQTIEEIVIKGMPLGTHFAFPYKKRETSLAPGDTVLLMSDGFPELFNNKDEMLDYDRVKEIFKEAGERTADEIVEHLAESGKKWRHGRPQDDDITFVVLKVKHDRELW